MRLWLQSLELVVLVKATCLHYLHRWARSQNLVLAVARRRKAKAKAKQPLRAAPRLVLAAQPLPHNTALVEVLRRTGAKHLQQIHSR